MHCKPHCVPNYCGPIQIPGCNKVEICPPIHHKPIEFVKENCYTHIVPHIHPVDTKIINNHIYKSEHAFALSEQQINQIHTQNQMQSGLNGQFYPGHLPICPPIEICIEPIPPKYFCSSC